MPVYDLGGFALASETHVPGLRRLADESSRTPDIEFSIEHSRYPAPERSLFRWPGRNGLALGTFGDDWLVTWSGDACFLIARDGRTVRAICSPAGLDREASDLLVRRILPRVSLLFGAVVLHAAALSLDGGVVLMLGGSGAGKSTLSAALAYHHGWDLLSDDISIVRYDGVATVAPAATGVCVWPDSREALQLPGERCRVLPAYQTKVWFDLDQQESSPARPVRAIVSLARSVAGGEPSLRSIPAPDALVLAIHQLVQFNPAGGGRELDRLVQRLRSTIRHVPAYRVNYGADYGALPKLAGLLARLAR